MNHRNILISFGVFLIGVLALSSSVFAQTSLRYTQDIYFGLKNSQVSQLQHDLAKDTTVYPEGLVTGYFGPLTLRAVKNFQAKYGIRQTGYAGPITRGKLNELYNEPMSTSFILPPITSKDSICTLPYGNETNITDPNYPLVAESKKVVLDFGISEDYFSKHFKLLCAVADQSSHRQVRWQYTIGEFTTIIYDEIGFSGSTNIHGINNDLYGLTEIQNVISKADAGQHMQSCIGNFKEARVGFVFPNGFDRRTSHAKPYLVARSVKEERGLDTTWDVGNIDPQTGECIKGSGGVIHAPLSP